MGTTMTFDEIVLCNVMVLCMCFEGFGNNGAPYQDSTGIWTNGFGTTTNNGVPVGPNTPVITRAQAIEFMSHSVMDALVIVGKTPVPMTIAQRTALGSFVYNVGPGEVGDKDGFVWLADGSHSTLYKCLIARDFDGAAAQMPLWDRAGGRVLGGLENRRLAEKQIFTGQWPLRNGHLLSVPKFPDPVVEEWGSEVQSFVLALRTAPVFEPPTLQSPAPEPNPITEQEDVA
jgi:lysozyme